MNSKKGFNLIETITYLGFTIIILPVIIYFFSNAIQTMMKNQVVADVERSASLITQILTQTIRNADRINLPLLGGSSSTLSLIIFSGAATTTAVFDLNNGKIQMQEGASAAVFLNSADVVVSNLLFFNASRGGTVGSIKVQFNLNKDIYSKLYYVSASLRKH
ncbi:MAG: hypothetical protein AAB847_00690 [Patescibacteria group bacterium]